MENVKLQRHLDAEAFHGKCLLDVQLQNPNWIALQDAIQKCGPAKMSLFRVQNDGEELLCEMRAVAQRDSVLNAKCDSFEQGKLKDLTQFQHEFRQLVSEAKALPKGTDEDACGDKAVKLEAEFSKAVVHVEGLKKELKNLKKFL